jgi:hypothetical protein
MDDAFGVSSLQGFGNLLRDPDGFPDGECAPPQPIGQRRPGDVFEHQKWSAARFLQAVDRSYARVVERGQQASFARETRQPIVVEQLRPDEFKSDETFESGIGRPVYHTHATGSETFVDCVRGGRSPAGISGSSFMDLMPSNLEIVLRL